MKRLVLTAGLVLGLAPFIVAQDNASNGQSSTQTTTANTQTTTPDRRTQRTPMRRPARPLKAHASSDIMKIRSSSPRRLT